MKFIPFVHKQRSFFVFLDNYHCISGISLCKNSQKTPDLSQGMNGIAVLAILHPKNA